MPWVLRILWKRNPKTRGETHRCLMTSFSIHSHTWQGQVGSERMTPGTLQRHTTTSQTWLQKHDHFFWKICTELGDRHQFYQSRVRNGRLMRTMHDRTPWSAWFHQVRVDCHRDTEKNHVEYCGGHSPLSNIHENPAIAPHDVGKIDVSHVSGVSQFFATQNCYVMSSRAGDDKNVWCFTL